MDQLLSAIYEHGSLRLLEPVDLAEASPVQVQIVAPPDDFQTAAFKRQLARIQELLLTFEKEKDSALVRSVFLQILQTDLHGLWALSKPPRRLFCTMLQLAANRLRPETLNQEQLAAIRFGLDQMALPTVTDAELRLSLERLAAAGIPATFAFSAELVQSYVDEL